MRKRRWRRWLLALVLGLLVLVTRPALAESGVAVQLLHSTLIGRPNNVHVAIVLPQANLAWKLVNSSSGKATVSALCQKARGQLCLNASYFDPSSGLPTSVHNPVLESGLRLTVPGVGPENTLVDRGVVTVRKDDGNQPRTAIGRRADGSMLAVVVDGRQHGSGGASMAELGALMKHLGAVWAVNLDGGGSSTMASPQGVLNRPANALVRTNRGLKVAESTLVRGVVKPFVERPVANALVAVPLPPKPKLAAQSLAITRSTPNALLGNRLDRTFQRLPVQLLAAHQPKRPVSRGLKIAATTATLLAISLLQVKYQTPAGRGKPRSA